MNILKIKNKNLQNLINGFELELVKAAVPESNIKECLNHINEFLNFLDSKNIQQINQVTQAIVNDYLYYLEHIRTNTRRGGTLKTSTINKHKNNIRKFWSYLSSENTKVVSLHLKAKPKVKEDTIVLTKEEINQLYSVCNETAIGYRDKAMLALYYGCGLRKSEGLRLLVTDIDFNRNRIRIRKTKTNRERYVMMSPTVQQQIEDYLYSYRDFYLPEGSQYEEFFISERGKPVAKETLVKRIETLWLRVKEKYGTNKQVTLHKLRHTLGTHLYMKGFEIDMIALMLGHRTLESTQLYIHNANLLNYQRT